MEMVHFIPPTQRRLAMLAAQADSAPVLIIGGSGTGKGAIGKWIHLSSPRSAKPFVNAVHEKSLSKQIAEAQGGTLMIPEIGSFGLGEQRVLLDFLLTRSIPSSLADIKMISHTRIMTTSSLGLEGRAQGGLFNAELLSKLNVFRLEMPTLAERQEEFQDIAHGILSEITADLHKQHLRLISDEALAQLKAYEWPGNLRELRNVLRISALACKTDRIEASDLPQFGHSNVNFRQTREKFEKVYIQEILNNYGWELERTCELARMDRGVLISKIKKYGLDPENRLGLG